MIARAVEQPIQQECNGRVNILCANCWGVITQNCNCPPEAVKSCTCGHAEPLDGTWGDFDD